MLCRSSASEGDISAGFVNNDHDEGTGVDGISRKKNCVTNSKSCAQLGNGGAVMVSECPYREKSSSIVRKVTAPLPQSTLLPLGRPDLAVPLVREHRCGSLALRLGVEAGAVVVKDDLEVGAEFTKYLKQPRPVKVQLPGLNLVRYRRVMPSSSTSSCCVSPRS